MLAAVVVAVLFMVLTWYIDPTKPTQKKDLALARILGGTALLSGLYFTWRTLQVNREGQITERFTLAIDQVGVTAVHTLADRIQPILQVSEIREVASDRLWMSINYGEDTVGSHFTWKPEREAVEDVLVQLEAALVPFEARPHWGKLFKSDAAAIAPPYERMPDFIRLVERLDPRGAFSNSWLKARVLGGS